LSVLRSGSFGGAEDTPSKPAGAPAPQGAEAAGTGKPVYVQRLKGNSRRLARFHTLMQERGATRPFQGKLEAWTYAPINDTEVVASAIRRALGLEKGRS
jgi:mitochondrial fission protein ELM1